MQRVLALAACDSRIEDLVQLLKAHKEELTDIRLIAAQETGKFIQESTGLPVTLLRSETPVGNLQIGALVGNDEVQSVIFYREPLDTRLQEPVFLALLRICDIHDVPMATNFGTAEAVIHLLAEHPEALSGHHLAAGFLEEIAYKHD
jgi:methylglyoxal synthase